jgi:hypothetical protein
MTTTGERIFRDNARATLAFMNMDHLDLSHGAAVNVVRWCLSVHGRPTHHRQVFLEQENPALLAYLEKIASSGDASGWRALRGRIDFRLEILLEAGLHPCPRPWLAAIWFCLPELAAIGQSILDRQLEDHLPVSQLAAELVALGDADGKKGQGDAGKAGAADTMARSPAPRLVLPVIPVVLSDAEKRSLGLEDDDIIANAGPNGTDETTCPGGPKGPGDRP